jgi:hypothetical protein
MILVQLALPDNPARSGFPAYAEPGECAMKREIGLSFGAGNREAAA